MDGVASASERTVEFVKNLGTDLITSPLNLCLLAVCVVLIFKIFRMKNREDIVEEPEPQMPRIRKDFTLDELRKYDGNSEEGRVLVALNCKVFDVTRNGKQFYGPGGPYAVFAGRDASRALATFSLEISALREGYDDLSDLGTQQMDSLKEWELQFQEKYIYVGKLLRPGESATHYSDDEEDITDTDKDKRSTGKSKSQ